MNDPKFQLNNNAHVWILNVKSEIANLRVFNEVLCQDEKTKADKFRFEKDKNTSIIARGALRMLLGKYLNTTPKSISFKYGEFGKPELTNNQNLKFNVSHSKDLIVIGFVNYKAIGIDVEYIKRDFDVIDIVDNYFSKKEIVAICNIPKKLQTEVFFRGWTRKEAFIKANAKGLSFPLDSFSVSIDSDEKAELYETIWNSHEKNNWKIIPFKTLPEYKAAVVLSQKIDTIKFLDFEITDF